MRTTLTSVGGPARHSRVAASCGRLRVRSSADIVGDRCILSSRTNRRFRLISRLGLFLPKSQSLNPAEQPLGVQR